jgi:hypothetical protein
MSSVFGLNEFNQLLHVSEVERGLDCQCRCVQCQEPLVARQGQVRGHHFAHASNREACESNHETLLHWYAKRLIVEARGLVVPMTPAAAAALGASGVTSVEILHAQGEVKEEVYLGDIRPDVLVTADSGVMVAIEVAYSSFCDVVKTAAFAAKGMPALEIDLSAFTPDTFDPVMVKEAVIRSVDDKRWVWPTEMPAEATTAIVPKDPQPTPVQAQLPQEKIDFSGRWVFIRQLPSGDIAIKVGAWDPDLVPLVKSVAKAHAGEYNPKYKTWIVPRRWAATVRTKLKREAEQFEITMTPRASA